DQRDVPPGGVRRKPGDRQEASEQPHVTPEEPTAADQQPAMGGQRRRGGPQRDGAYTVDRGGLRRCARDDRHAVSTGQAQEAREDRLVAGVAIAIGPDDEHRLSREQGDAHCLWKTAYGPICRTTCSPTASRRARRSSNAGSIARRI